MNIKSLLKNGKRNLSFKFEIETLGLGQEHGDLAWIQSYLTRLGYLIEATYQPGRLDESTSRALKRYQTFQQLEPSGILDKSTIQDIQEPRCGNIDLTDPSLIDVEADALEANSAAIIRDLRIGAGCDLKGSLTLTYTISNKAEDLPPTLTFNQVKTAIDLAFETWKAVIPVDLKPDQGSATANFKIRWAKDQHGDIEKFDDPGGLIAHAFYPKTCGGDFAGLCHFDNDEKWNLFHDSDTRVFDVQTVALHEIGHLLGLKHSDDVNSVMFPKFRKPQIHLTADVVAAIQGIYGQRV